jgi:hypothetical protein
MNFGETLAYWYLRFNGFFPLANFVLHRGAEGLLQSADSDLLAVRFPHTYEAVGGQPDDWDREAFDRWGIDLGDSVALIVEVKTGGSGQRLREGVRRAFSYGRLLYATRRLGIIPVEHTHAVADYLTRNAIYRDPDTRITVASLLITSNLPRPRDLPPCLMMPLDHAESFIRARLRDYLDPKREARMFFPSDLLQYLIWSGDRRNPGQPGP